jgi:hypothetical protein
MYTSHLVLLLRLEASSGYVTIQTKAYALTSDADAFRTGAGAYRNVRDWARQMRDEAIKKANETSAQDGPSLPAPLDDLALSFASS